MSYLLDTHTLLWAISAPDRLGPGARAVLEDPGSALWVSAASAWEISIKHQRGRLPQAELLLSTYDAILTRLGASQLAISSQHAILAGRLNWPHRDPFDRMLAAQAIIASATLITDDARLREAPGVTTLW